MRNPFAMGGRASQATGVDRATGAPPDLRVRLANAWSMERPAERLTAALTLLSLTLVSPYVPLPGPLPSIRLEQVVLVLVAIPMLRLIVRHPEMRRVSLVDASFLALVIATTITILLAPIIVAGASRSFRDVFEVVRIGEYWLIFRIGLTLAPAGPAGGRIARWLAIAAIGLGTFAILQYLELPAFNDTVTAIWTQSHNLLGVVREGRAVGTAGNANQFGILSVLLLFVALVGRIAAPRRAPAWMWGTAIAAATVSLVLAQSRGAILGAGLGLVAAAGLLAIRRTARRGIVVAAPAMVAALLVVVALVMAAPPSSGSILRRFDIAGILRDPSVVIRLGRVQSLFAGTAAGQPDTTGDRTACVASLTPPATPDPGHEPGAAALPAAPTADPARVASAVAGYYCDNRRWPSDLARDLIPAYLPALPTSPGGSLSLYSSPRGFAVGTARSVDDRAEDAGVGSLPNLLANPSFEDGGSPPAQWLVTPGTVATTTASGAAFSVSAADVILPTGGAVYQLVVADLPMDTDFAFGLWARSTEAGAASLQLYVVAITADGQRVDPLATRTVTLPAGTAWQHLGLVLHTPTKHLTSLQVMVRAPQAPAHAVLDGASLTEGPFALPFGSLLDQPATAAGNAGGPSFWESPIIGIGPQKDDAVPVFDNEYASFLAHYGIVGLGAYLLLFGAAFLVGLRAALRVPEWGGLLGVSLAGFTIALGAFAISAGAYGQLQVMVIYWLLVGVVAAIASRDHASSGLGATDPI